MLSVSGRATDRFSPRGVTVALALVLSALVSTTVSCAQEDVSTPGAARPPTPLRSTTTTTSGPTTGPTTASIPPPGPTTTLAAPSIPAVGTSEPGTVTTGDGRTRTHHVYAATSVRGARAPTRLLVVALHGGGESGRAFEQSSGLDGWAEANDAVVVHPDGIGSGTDGATMRTWNGGGCCGVAASQRVDDVGYLRLLIEQLSAAYAVAPGRVAAIGYSNGGMLAYRLACELSDSVSAIGVQASTFQRRSCTPARPVAVLHVHGTADDNLPIDGGVGSESSADITFNSPREGVQILASAAGCAPRATEVTDPTNVAILTRTWSPCAGGAQVTMIEVAGGRHPWMTPSSEGSAGLDSTALLWQFVASHLRG